VLPTPPVAVADDVTSADPLPVAELIELAVPPAAPFPRVGLSII
jgi:hypothetical protein